MSRGRVFRWLSVLLPLLHACDLINPANSQDYQPSRLPVGELTLSTWLPAGLPEYRFSEQDQSNLAALGLNQVEWLQRAEVDERTAEELAMGFCNTAGLTMPVYYEPPGYSPYDKLHNWATRDAVEADFDDAVRERVLGLKARWQGSAGFGGYLIGHEDYSKSFYEALSRTVSILQAGDPGRPAVTVGHIDHYPEVGRFLDAFFGEGGGAPNIFQHEHYVFRDGVPGSGRGLQRRLDDLVAGYGRAARHLQDRFGHWHAIVQVHSERRDGRGEQGLYYRKPTPGEIGVQVGMALARGASGIVYFLYSSGREEVRDADGNTRQTREYEGIVDVAGTPTPAYQAVQQLNTQLRRLSPVLALLHFHGGYSSSRGLPDDSPVVRADDDLELGLFGDGAVESHVLVVNRRPHEARAVRVEVTAAGVRDALSGESLVMGGQAVTVRLEAGGFRLIELAMAAADDAVE